MGPAHPSGLNASQIDTSFHRLRHRTVPSADMRAIPYEMYINRNLNSSPLLAASNEVDLATTLPRPFAPIRRKSIPEDDW